MIPLFGVSSLLSPGIGGQFHRYWVTVSHPVPYARLAHENPRQKKGPWQLTLPGTWTNTWNLMMSCGICEPFSDQKIIFNLDVGPGALALLTQPRWLSLANSRAPTVGN